MQEQNDLQIRKVARPSAEVEIPARPEGRVQRSTLTFVVSALLLLCGSGGILAEMFHTSQVFRKGRADYSSEANRVTGEALVQFWEKISTAETATGEAMAEALANARNSSASAEGGVALAEMEAIAKGANAQHMANTNKGLVPGKEQQHYFRILRNFLEHFKDDLNLDIQILVIQSREGGDFSQSFLPVPWDPKLDSSIYGIKCLAIPGLTSETCRPTLERASLQDQLKDVEPPSAKYVLSPLSESEKTKLAEYRRALEDLEGVLIYNALDLKRYKDENQSTDQRSVNREWSRTLASLQLVRHRFQQIDELETLYKRSERDQTLPVLDRIVRDMFSSDLENGHSVEPAAALRIWVDAKLPLFVRAASEARQRELANRSSEFYQSIRPVLANIWNAWNLGTVSPLIVSGLRSHKDGLLVAPSGTFEPVGERIPNSGMGFLTALVFAAMGLGLVGLAVWYLVKSFPIAGRFAVVSLASLIVVLLAFLIQQALAVNQSTEKLASNLVSDVMPTSFAREYTHRALDAVQRISIKGRWSASQTKEYADAKGKLRVLEAKKRAERYIQALTLESGRVFMLLAPYDELEQFCTTLTEVSVRDPCVKNIRAAKTLLGKTSGRFRRTNSQPSYSN